VSAAPSTLPTALTRVLFFMENDTTTPIQLPLDHAEVMKILEAGINTHSTFTLFYDQPATRLGESGTIGVAWDKVISFQVVEIKQKVQDK
jgi:hypothetical protein